MSREADRQRAKQVLFRFYLSDIVILPLGDGHEMDLPGREMDRRRAKQVLSRFHPSDIVILFFSGECDCDMREGCKLDNGD